MTERPVKVFIAGDNPVDCPFWSKFVDEIRDTRIEFVHIPKLFEISERLTLESPAVILLDLSNLGWNGLRDFLRVHDMTVNVPIIVVLPVDDPELGLQVVREGAQDCLVKGEMSGHQLRHAIRYAISRHNHLKQLRLFSVIDELTGLFNRRGFLNTSEHCLKLADLTRRSLLLVFADLDGLKAINDRQGHQKGDQALMETAHVLKEAFPEADVVARLGGDEFAALLPCGAMADSLNVLRRFRETLKEHNSCRRSGEPLSISVGVALYDPHFPCLVEDLLAQADQFMYAQKRSKEKTGV